ncbi:hypothetical protein [Saccharothrix xinjiangensis]|uniref:Uncharacterized protein n=1 Tax=Saccharothrix xinjiangensis TaxID=204798 RepID=A0ABV9XY34_9PSEU
MPLNPDTGIWDSSYTPPTPHDLPAVRLYLREVFAQPEALAFHTTMVKEDRFSRDLIRSPHPERAARLILDGERERLAHAALYWVSPEMTQVVTAAATTLPEDLRVDETHQPAEHGFIVFAEPIGSYLGDALGDRRVDIAAASWGPLPGVPDATGVTFYSVRDLDYARHCLTRILGRPPKRAELDAALSASPEWMWDNEMTLHHGNTIADLDLIGQLTTLVVGQAVVPWMKVLYAAWLLMTQPGISETEQVTPNRRLQRREAREGVRSSEVRIVHVHRRHRDKPTGSQSSGSGERRYTVRWLVRGHWRNQAHGPDRSLRRLVWINPQVRGPQDKPLKTGHTVHVWDRPTNR